MGVRSDRSIEGVRETTPRQALCWSYYVDPYSSTFSNATTSALRAGYSRNTSLDIQIQPWFVVKQRKLGLLDKAERVLAKTMDMVTEKRVVYCGEETEIVREDAALLKIQQDSAKFVAETVGKADYSKRQEITGEGGKDLPTPILVGLLQGGMKKIEESVTDVEAETA